jgi:aryl-alcohol dehydrogenase-like predicted oxidoreductase
MKSLGIAAQNGWPRYAAHQVYYSLIGRDYEWELMPLGLDHGVGALVWSPLGWGQLTGKIRRGQPLPEASRLHATAQFAPPVSDERLYNVIDALQSVADEIGESIPQVALAWLLTRPTVSSVIIGARNEAQLRDNLGAIGWSLTTEQIARLNAARDVMPAYPYYPYRTQEGFARLNPPRYEVCWTTFSHAMSSTAVRQEASKAHVWSPSRA